MTLFKRKNDESKPRIQVGRIIKLDKETIALEGLCITDKQKEHFFVKETIWITSEAEVTGNIVASAVILEGKVIGNITCGGEITLKPTSIIEGTVMARTAVIEDGSIINGTMLLSPDLKTTSLAAKIAEVEILLEKERAAKSQDLIKEEQTNVMPEKASPVSGKPESEYQQTQVQKTTNTEQQKKESWW